MKKLRRDGVFSPWAEVGVGTELKLGPACQFVSRVFYSGLTRDILNSA